jgi:hypothetical protein
MDLWRGCADFSGGVSDAARLAPSEDTDVAGEMGVGVGLDGARAAKSL